MMRAFIRMLVVAALAGFALASAKGRLTVEYAVDPAIDISAAATPDFASFSVEVPCAHYMIVNSSGLPRTSYLNLMRNLRDTSGNTGIGPNLRIGGNSADETYFASSGSCPAHLPPGDRDCITPNEVLTYRHVSLWSGTAVVDLNLRNATNPHNAVEYALNAKAALNGTGVLEAFEIGNEPDLFAGNGIRNHSYTYHDYVEDFAHELNAMLGAGFHGKFVQGATFCCYRWRGDLTDYVNVLKSNLKTLSLHHYPMSGHDASIAKLMNDEASSMRAYEPIAKLASEHGIRFVIGEGNSASGGGSYGISNTFASSLWSIDMLLQSLRAGITRFNFHGCPSGSYTPIDTDQFPYAYARPLYYGMWFFTAAMSDGARLVANKLVNDGGDSNQGGYRVYAARSPTEVRVIIVGKGANLANITDSPPLTAVVNISGVKAGAVGRVYRLVASVPMRLDVTSGLSFRGQTLDGSVDGLPLGPMSNETVIAGSDGRVELKVDPATAVLACFSYEPSSS